MHDGMPYDPIQGQGLKVQVTGIDREFVTSAKKIREF